MRPPRSRNDLIALAVQHAPTNACRKAFQHGDILVVGGFAPVDCFPYFVLRATHPVTKRRWYLKVEIDEERRRIRVRETDRQSLHWAAWCGTSASKPSLYAGDNPILTAFYKMRSTRHGQE